MTPERFNQIVDERKAKISNILQRKSLEYSRDGDRLHNFNRASAFARKAPTTVAWLFNLKHLTSIADLVDDLEAGKTVTQSLVDEKIGDAVNYLILLEALIIDRAVGKKKV